MEKINGSTPLMLFPRGEIGVVGQPVPARLTKAMEAIATTLAYSFLGGEARADEFSLDALRGGAEPEAHDRPYGASCVLRWQNGQIVLTITESPSEGTGGEWSLGESESEKLSLEEFLKRNALELA